MDLTRRGLLRGLLGGAAALALPGVELVLPELEDEVVSTKTTFVLGDGQHKSCWDVAWKFYLDRDVGWGEEEIELNIADHSAPRFHGIPGKSSLKDFDDFVGANGPSYLTSAEKLINEAAKQQYTMRNLLRPMDAVPPTFKGIPILQHRP